MTCKVRIYLFWSETAGQFGFSQFEIKIDLDRQAEVVGRHRLKRVSVSDLKQTVQGRVDWRRPDWTATIQRI